MPLTDVRIRSLKPANKPHKYSDGGGLFLFIPPSGSKLWRMAYRFEGKSRLLSFGAYPAVSLKDARERRDEAGVCWRRVSIPPRTSDSSRKPEELPNGTVFKTLPANGTPHA